MIQDFLIKVAADYVLILIILIGAYALVFKIPKERRFKAYCRILVAGLTAYLLAKLVGSIYQPEALRPFELMGKTAGASYLNNAGFPSDHVLFATAIVCAVWFETKQKSITWILAVLVLVVAVGRVLALVHTPIDVIGGVVFALAGSLWYLNSKE
ncbi:MAG: phosphatase PAP2 family protein [Candidatus Saccharibacteria bacterium]|nr:phosphatase PAP2 family protein [Candidatus Saccharibacteria bacterium]